MGTLATLRSIAWHGAAILFYAGVVWFSLPHIGRLLSLGPASVGEVPRTESNLLCKTTVLQELESPNQSLVARLTSTDCGGTTGWSSGVSVFDKQTRTTHRGLLLLEGIPDSYRIQWTDSSTLLASGFQARDVQALRQSKDAGVRVILSPLPAS